MCIFATDNYSLGHRVNPDLLQITTPARSWNAIFFNFVLKILLENFDIGYITEFAKED